MHIEHCIRRLRFVCCFCYKSICKAHWCLLVCWCVFKIVCLYRIRRVLRYNIGIGESNVYWFENDFIETEVVNIIACHSYMHMYGTRVNVFLLYCCRRKGSNNKKEISPKRHEIKSVSSVGSGMKRNEANSELSCQMILFFLSYSLCFFSFLPLTLGEIFLALFIVYYYYWLGKVFLSGMWKNCGGGGGAGTSVSMDLMKFYGFHERKTRYEIFSQNNWFEGKFNFPSRKILQYRVFSYKYYMLSTMKPCQMKSNRMQQTNKRNTKGKI